LSARLTKVSDKSSHQHVYTRALNVIVYVSVYCDLDKVLIEAESLLE